MKRLVTGVILALGAIVLGTAVWVRINDVHFQTVVSGSMTPLVSPGDLALTKPVPVDTLAVGDVIAFYPPGQSIPVLHRITSLTLSPQGPVVTTRGDANRVEDSWQATLKGGVAYRYIGAVPLVGWLSELTPYRGWILIAAGLLIGLAFVREQLKHRKEVQRPIGPSAAA